MILTWSLATLCWNGQFLPTYSIEAPDIADLSLQPSNGNPAQGYPSQPKTNEIHQAPPARTQKPFVDPAILSFSKPELHQHDKIAGPGRQRHLPGNMGGSSGAQGEPPVSAVLSEPFSNLELNVNNRTGPHGIAHEKESDGSAPVESAQASVRAAGKKARRAGRTKSQRDNRHELSPVNEHDGASNTNPKTKGWRQTAFVQPSHSHLNQSPQSYKGTPRQNGPRRKKRNRGAYAEDPNGWATEDATDIQEMGDFDFQSNLSKFDKRRVFEEIKNDDTTADEARLVSFNKKVPKPGTNGGKNLHWSENVLDSPQSSDSADSDEEASGEKLSSGNYSGRDRSRASARTHSSRKSSAILGQPLMSQHINSVGRSQLSASPISVPSGSGGSLRLTTTNRSCPTVSPLQTLEVEQIAVAELGLTEDIITENAGRGIAEAAVGLLPNDSAAPTVLVLTGNHRTGTRAIAAARHLRNRGHRVTICMLGLEHQTELLESCRKQLGVFRKAGGRVLRWEELGARMSSSEFTPDLVVDALFGMHLAFDDLRTEDQATTFEMIARINRSNIDALSVDVPSGLSASNGMCSQSL